MKHLLLCFCLSLSLTFLRGQSDIPAMLNELRLAIREMPSYDAKKQARIKALKQILENTERTTPREVFPVYKKLYEEYKVFSYDSAYTYALKLEESARQQNDSAAIAFARLKRSFCLLSAGMFKETAEIAGTINTKHLPDSSLAEFYALTGRYYYDLGDFDNDRYHTPGYILKGNAYLDSALSILQTGSFEHTYYTGLKQLKSGDNPGAQRNFNKLLEEKTLTDHQVAIAASTLSDIYTRSGNPNQAIILLARAVMADIRSSTKETSASFNLANLLYSRGDVKNASTCIELAINDAAFYGARQRKVKVSDILPLIEGEKVNRAENQQRIWTTYALLVTLLLAAVIVLVTVILRQVKKLKAAQQAILMAHIKEQEINLRLAETNSNLIEANKIKEEYLGYFFNVNSDFFDKIERFKNSLEQKIAERKTEDIKFLVNNINLRKEKEYLVQNFDKVFLKLFPNFIAEFNALFTEENRVVLKEDELLNTDLRIFALIRMGIHDNEKIARILQYSVNTINSYKTKIKNRSFVTNEEFEKTIMGIKSI